jgi:hypothetical protein
MFSLSCIELKKIFLFIAHFDAMEQWEWRLALFNPNPRK